MVSTWSFPHHLIPLPSFLSRFVSVSLPSCICLFFFCLMAWATSLWGWLIAIPFNLISLLENSDKLSAGQRIGLFSYGSGTVAEFFSGELVEGYENHLLKIEHQSMLDARTRLSIPEYENMFNQYLDLNHNISFNDETDYSVSEVVDNHRKYKKR